MPHERAAKLAAPTLALAMGLGGHLLRGPPLSPDDVFLWHRLAGVFLVFAAFAAGLLSWGGVCARALKLDASEPLWRLSLGTALGSFAMALFGHLGLVGFADRDLLAGVLLVGLLLDATLGRHPGGETRGWRLPASALDRLLAVGCAVLVLLQCAKAAIPDGHPDPLYYGLLGPRLWAQAGRIFMPEGMPIVLRASAWDYLHLWGQVFLGGPGGGGLVEAQIFGQLCHAALAYAGCGFAVYRLVGCYSADLRIRWLAVLAALAAAAMNWTAGLAKNDWGSAFWVLSAAALMAGSGVSPRMLLLGGALLGLGVIAKPSALFTAIPVVASVLWARGEPRRYRLALVMAGLALGALPVAARNLAWTGNPLFPSASWFFGTQKLSPSWIAYQRGFEEAGLSGLGSTWARVQLLWRQSPLVLALALPAIGSLLRRRWSFGGRTVWCLALTSTVLFLVASGPAASLRLLGAGDLLLAAAVPVSLEPVLAGRHRAVISVVLACATMAFGQLPWGAAANLLAIPSIPEVLQRNHSNLTYPPVGGDARSWLRVHASAGERIASLDDNRLYYLAHLNVVALREDPGIERRVDGLPDDRLPELLRDLNVRYALVVTDWRGAMRRRTAARLGPWLDRRSEAVVFRSDDALVIDLAKPVPPP